MYTLLTTMMIDGELVMTRTIVPYKDIMRTISTMFKISNRAGDRYPVITIFSDIGHIGSYNWEYNFIRNY